MAKWFLGRALAEEAEATEQAWSFLGKDATFWTMMAVLLVVGVAGYLLTRRKSGKKSFWTAKTMAVGAMCMALSSVLSLIKLWSMPMGGSITPASMLPLLLFAYCYGVGPGMVLGALYGVMQFLLDGMAWAALGAIPNLLDYPIAFALLGLAGVFHDSSKAKAKKIVSFMGLADVFSGSSKAKAKKNVSFMGLAGVFRGSKAKMIASFTLGCFGRFMASFLSGFIFYGEYAPEGMNPVWYSLTYNGSYMLVECVICIVIGLFVGERLAKELRRVA